MKTVIAKHRLAEPNDRVRRFGLLPRAGLGSVLGLSLTLGSVTVAQAGLIPIDVSIDGSIEFDTGNSFIDGGASQSGTLRATVGGSNTDTTYSGNLPVGANPILASFTDTDDGLSLFGSAAGSNVDDEFFTGIDLSMTLANSSATDTYEVVVRISYDQDVDSDGTDAYAESAFTVDEPGPVEVFFSEILSDTVNGDQKDGVPLGTFGALVEDMGIDFLTINLAPGASTTLAGALTLEGGVFLDPGSAGGNFSFSLTIDGVDNVTPTDPTIPIPGTLLLLGGGLAVLTWRRRQQA
jgi:hypothetical protein